MISKCRSKPQPVTEATMELGSASLDLAEQAVL